MEQSFSLDDIMVSGAEPRVAPFRSGTFKMRFDGLKAATKRDFKTQEPVQAIAFVFSRDGKEVTKKVTPKLGEKAGLQKLLLSMRGEIPVEAKSSSRALLEWAGETVGEYYLVQITAKKFENDEFSIVDAVMPIPTDNA